MPGFLWTALFLCLFGFYSQTLAADNENLDELLQGFDDADSKTPAPETDELDILLQGFDETPAPEAGVDSGTEQTSSNFKAGLSLRTGLSYNIAHSAPDPGDPDFRGLSRARLQLVPEVRWKMAKGWRGVINASTFYDASYAINGRDQYSDETLKEYETETELREFYVQGEFSPGVDLKIGRQIVVWGKADNLRVVDVLNPLDMREPGMVDIEDLRLPLTMIISDYYFGNWQLSSITIPEIRFNKRPAYGSEFYPSGAPPAPEIVPASDWDNMEFAVALSGRFQGWDISFHAASIYNDDIYIDPGPPPGLRHSRVNMGGLAFNAVSGSFLYKSEIAYFDGLEYSNGGNEGFSRVDALLGFDYNGFSNITLTLEVMDRYLLDYLDALESPPDETKEHEAAMSFRYTQTFMYERLELMLLATLTGDLGESGAFYRAQLSYDLSDGLNLTGGGVFYQGGDSSFFDAIADNDRLFVELKYDL